jgi:hypothetical protein
MTARRRGSGPSYPTVEPVWPTSVVKISFVFFETAQGAFEIYGFNVYSLPVVPLWKWPTPSQNLVAVMAYLATLIATGPTEGPAGHPPGATSSAPSVVCEAATRGADSV